jgi:hypothetical protein
VPGAARCILHLKNSLYSDPARFQKIEQGNPAAGGDGTAATSFPYKPLSDEAKAGKNLASTTQHRPYLSAVKSARLLLVEVVMAMVGWESQKPYDRLPRATYTLMLGRVRMAIACDITSTNRSACYPEPSLFVLVDSKCRLFGI